MRATAARRWCDPRLSACGTWRRSAALGGLEALDVHSPDRLARKYRHQTLLLEEFARVGVRVVFLNQAHQQTPEDEVLLQVQGVIAEDERARDH
jgi:site-specific DNA recombinase